MFNEPTNLNYKADLVQIGELAFIDPSLVSAMYCSSKTGAFVIRFAGMGYSEYFADDLFLSYSETAQAIFNEQKRSNSTSWPLDKKAVIESSEFYHRKKQDTAVSILEEIIAFAEDKVYCIDTADEQTEFKSLLDVAKDLMKAANQETDKEQLK